MSITQTVAAIGRLGFTGNVTPKIWYKRILTPSGKADFKAITLLSDILYWYRPTEIRDEATGQVVEYRKKFAADKLQRSYDKFAEGFGMTKREVREALVRLRDAGLITLEFRTVKIMGQLVANVLYVEPVATEIDHITFSDFEELATQGQADECVTESGDAPADARRVTSKRNTPQRENVIGDTANRHTNTEITTEITTETKNLDLLCDSAESNAPAEIDPVQKFDAKSKRAMLIDAFESFWSAYQKKSGRKTALNSFLKIKLPNDQAVAIELINTIINQAKRWGDLYALAPTDEKQFQPHPSTWINNERWTDEALPTVGAPRPNFSRPSNGFDADQARETFSDWANGNTGQSTLGSQQADATVAPNENDIDGEWWK